MTMRFMKTNTVDITVNGETYNSLRDFGLAIENTDYLGEPEQGENNLIYVAGRDGPLDTTDAVFGGQYFTKRKIEIKLGGLEDPTMWDIVISNMRNKFEGKKVKLAFQTIPGWYFTGRCRIKNYKHVRALGTFTLEIPNADPYMYREKEITVTATTNGTPVSIPITRKTAVPTVKSSSSITIVKDGTNYSFEAGTHKDEKLRFTEGENEIAVKGSGTVTISYIDGSL